jgi:hypothetical protein
VLAKYHRGDSAGHLFAITEVMITIRINVRVTARPNIKGDSVANRLVLFMS